AEQNRLLRHPVELQKREEQVVEYKTARYTIAAPVTLGAQFAKAPTQAIGELTRFGSALGRAFQYRDDVLGVFGDESVTGKPSGDDLREGKLTALIAHTVANANPGEIDLLSSLIGNPELDEEGIEWLRSTIVDSGALAATEAQIAAAYDQALATLDSLEITDAAQTALRALATRAVKREA
ncbi:MAG: polyprenyl synthetase family protein, partial [Propionibacteriaceae bacterium]|nr:polyprenyl synthetase family protein [Propionibacteriaceae bacterium]